MGLLLQPRGRNQAALQLLLLLLPCHAIPTFAIGPGGSGWQDQWRLFPPLPVVSDASALPPATIGAGMLTEAAPGRMALSTGLAYAPYAYQAQFSIVPPAAPQPQQISTIPTAFIPPSATRAAGPVPAPLGAGVVVQEPVIVVAPRATGWDLTGRPLGVEPPRSRGLDSVIAGELRRIAQSRARRTTADYARLEQSLATQELNRLRARAAALGVALPPEEPAVSSPTLSTRAAVPSSSVDDTPTATELALGRPADAPLAGFLPRRLADEAPTGPLRMQFIPGANRLRWNQIIGTRHSEAQLALLAQRAAELRSRAALRAQLLRLMSLRQQQLGLPASTTGLPPACLAGLQAACATLLRPNGLGAGVVGVEPGLAAGTPAVGLGSGLGTAAGVGAYPELGLGLGAYPGLGLTGLAAGYPPLGTNQGLGAFQLGVLAGLGLLRAYPAGAGLQAVGAYPAAAGLGLGAYPALGVESPQGLGMQELVPGLGVGITPGIGGVGLVPGPGPGLGLLDPSLLVIPGAFGTSLGGGGGGSYAFRGGFGGLGGFGLGGRSVFPILALAALAAQEGGGGLGVGAGLSPFVGVGGLGQASALSRARLASLASGFPGVFGRAPGVGGVGFGRGIPGRAARGVSRGFGRARGRGRGIGRGFGRGFSRGMRSGLGRGGRGGGGFGRGWGRGGARGRGGGFGRGFGRGGFGGRGGRGRGG